MLHRGIWHMGSVTGAELLKNTTPPSISLLAV